MTVFLGLVNPESAYRQYTSAFRALLFFHFDVGHVLPNIMLLLFIALFTGRTIAVFSRPVFREVLIRFELPAFGANFASMRF